MFRRDTKNVVRALMIPSLLAAVQATSVARAQTLPAAASAGPASASASSSGSAAASAGPVESAATATLASNHAPGGDGTQLEAAPLEGGVLEEVAVTATKISTASEATLLEGVQNIPNSISIVSGAELSNLDAFDVNDILERTSDAHWNYGTPRTGSLSLRGVSGLASTNMQPSVGTTVDGVSLADTALFSIQDFTDVSDLEVVRGPTGTDGGKNSSLGVLDITNNKPTFTPDANVSLTMGTSGTVKGQAAAGGPIIDGLLAWRGSFYTDRQKGPYPNAYNPDATYLNTDRTGGRLQFLLTPTDGLSILLADYYQPSSHEYVNGLAFNEPVPATYANGVPVNVANLASTKLSRSWFTQENNYDLADYYNSVIDNDAGGPVVFSTQGRSATINWQAGRYLLTSISSYNAYTQEAQNDDGTPFDITKQGGYILDYYQLSQELRLSSSVGDLLDYRVGLYYLTTQLLAYNRSDYGSDAGAYYANAAQYNALDATAAGQILMQDALDRLKVVDQAQYDYDTRAAYAHVTWKFTEPFNLVTGLRLTREYRSDQENKAITDNGYGAGLNPASVDNVGLGGFSISNTGALTASNSINQLQLADQLANKYYGAAITSTPGAAYNSLSAAQKTQVADAAALRLAQISGLFLPTRAQPFEQTIPTWEISPTFKFSGDQELAYLLWQRGEKPGISQIVNATVNGGASQLVAAEISNTYEVGLKSALLQSTLAINADLFVDDIHNYQQSVYFYDAYLTQLLNNGTLQFISGTGSVPRVLSKGVEVDAGYTGISHLSLHLSTSYADARYKATTLLAQPVEDANLATPYYNANGRTLPNSPKFTGDLGADYHLALPLGGPTKDFHAIFNYWYTSSYNADPSLSQYYVVPGYGLLDLSLGYGREDGRYDISIVVKNVFNTQYRYEGWSSWIPSPERWAGLQISSKLL